MKDAYNSLEKFGTAPTILNAANEIAVEAFLDKKIKFNDIAKFIEKTLNKIDIIDYPTIEDILRTDKEARAYVKSLIY
jgi:1-deoxy-D-xylulose-5-phosphate reductoisomerase